MYGKYLLIIPYFIYSMTYGGDSTQIKADTTKAPKSELELLIDARDAAEQAQLKIQELREGREEMIKYLEGKKAELKKIEAERDSIKAKLSK